MAPEASAEESGSSEGSAEEAELQEELTQASSRCDPAKFHEVFGVYPSALGRQLAEAVLAPPPPPEPTWLTNAQANDGQLVPALVHHQALPGDAVQLPAGSLQVTVVCITVGNLSCRLVLALA